MQLMLQVVGVFISFRVFFSPPHRSFFSVDCLISESAFLRRVLITTSRLRGIMSAENSTLRWPGREMLCFHHDILQLDRYA